MIVGTKAPGRPYHVAVIPFRNDRVVELLSTFYKVCSTFRYHEVASLSRALAVTERTVLAWRYRERKPRWDIMMDIIDWDKEGRPTLKRYQEPRRGGMF